MKTLYQFTTRLLFFISFICFSLTINAQNTWINEFHYDNTGTDANEFVEIIIENAGSYNLNLFQLHLYNGNNALAGVTYGTAPTLDLFSVGSSVGNFTIYYYSYPVDGIQNGARDGFALTYNGVLIPGQFLSYEGTMVASNGPAIGLTSTDVGQQEGSSTPVGYSIQLNGTGNQYSDFTWQPPSTATAGNINNGQTLVTGGINNPSNFTAAAVSTSQIDLSWALNGNSDSVLIAYSTSNTFGVPTGVYTIGDPITGGGIILYKGTGISASHSSLPVNTEYYYTAWSYTTAHAYSAGVVDSATTLKPEPSTFPSNFNITATGITITCDWNDATGETLPDAYLIRISEQDNIAAPVDGVPVANDLLVADGAGDVNVPFGTQAYTFFRLDETTAYYLKIFPYTNSGTYINYLTLGAPPALPDTTQSIIVTKDFEDNLWGDWTVYNVASNIGWLNLNTGGGAYATSRYASMNGLGGDVLSDDWLISPPLNLNIFTDDKMIFFNSWNLGTNENELKVKYSTNYIGGDPTGASWTELTYTKATTSLTWVPSGFIDLSTISGSAVHIAFQYLSESIDNAARTWRVDEVEITGSSVGNPSDFAASAVSSSQVDLSWNLNLQSDSVLIAFNLTNTFGTPSGIYSLNGAISGGGTVIYKGTGTSFNHTGLTPFTHYYYRAWSMDNDHSYSAGVAADTVTYKAEPSQYPADFASSSANITITTTWTSSAGDQFPDAYLLLISDLNNIVAPVDGVPVADDLNLTNGAGAINLNYGVVNYTFYHLNGNTEYFLKIYPYTNSGTNIDYKTDDPTPSASAVTAPVINQAGFEDNTFGTWTTYSVASNKNWAVRNLPGALNTAYLAEINGFQQDVLSNDWLISPSFDLDMYDDENIIFYTYWTFGDTESELKLKYSTNYNSGDPSLATWTELAFTRPAVPDVWTFSGDVDLSAITGSNVSIAFHYQGTNNPRRWRVDEIVITGTELEVINNPTNFVAAGISLNDITLSWNKNANNDDVVVAWNSVNVFGEPAGPLYEGNEIPGGGFVIYKGAAESFLHSGLNPETIYYYKAWSVDPSDHYSSGATATASTFFYEPASHPTGFDAVANSFSQITVSWVDSDADHYLVKASSVSIASITAPVDFVPESDGTLVKNVDASAQSAVFTGLMPSTKYYFKIFPYNGTGIVCNYKTDGEVPLDSATTTELDLDLIISEVTHPDDIANAKFVEIMNIGSTTVDFSATPVVLARQANGGSWANIPLTGILNPGEQYVIANNATDFTTAFVIAADLYNANVSGNGNDGYFLYYGTSQATGFLIDAFGVINQDGFGYPWEYTDSKAVRKRSVTNPNTTWTESEWVIPASAQTPDMTPYFHNGTLTWQGTTSTDWNAKGDNWDSPNGYIPDASCNVVIPFAGITNFPMVTLPSAVNKVEFPTDDSGASLIVSGTGSLLIVGEE